MIVRQTKVFASWFDSLRDDQARGRIEARLRRLTFDNPGDARPIGHGVSEMRIDHGPGYRIYYKRTNLRIVILLCGGDKSSQRRDIERALALAAME